VKIKVNNFYAVKHAEFEIETGITILAGRNGCGKSQLLFALASYVLSRNESFSTYRYDSEQAFGLDLKKLIKYVSIEPEPKKVLYRPPVREIGTKKKDEKYATLKPLKEYADIETGKGYLTALDPRYTFLHNRIATIYVAGNMNNASPENIFNWNTIKNSFCNVFNRHIDGIFDSRGCRVGILLDTNNLSDFNTLSTGELEFLSLMCDIVTEREVDLFLIDEIDVHFHPDLQIRVISEVEELTRDKKLIATSHSPALMLSASPGKLFFMKHFSEVTSGGNQIIKLSEDLKLISSLSEMYVGFIIDIRLSKHFLEAANYELLEYANQCLKASEVKNAECKDSDPQVSLIRALLLSKISKVVLIEIGAGKGRILNSFRSLPDEQLKKIVYIGIDINESNLAELRNYSDKVELSEKFNDFQLTNDLAELDNDLRFDFCILANIIHEVSPDRLAKFFNDLMKKAKNGSQVLILEALELIVGEKGFVLFDDNSIRAIFERYTKDYLLINSAKPTSYSGIPLLELLITVNMADNILIENQDIMRGLKFLIDSIALELAENLKNNIFDAKTLAFKCHNLANAEAYYKMMETAGYDLDIY